MNNLSYLKPGDTVVIVDCFEADKYKGRVWAVRSEPWIMCGEEVILLEGKSGGFATNCLRRVVS